MFDCKRTRVVNPEATHVHPISIWVPLLGWLGYSSIFSSWIWDSGSDTKPHAGLSREESMEHPGVHRARNAR